MRLSEYTFVIKMVNKVIEIMTHPVYTYTEEGRITMMKGLMGKNIHLLRENAVFTQLMSKFENMYYYKNENNTQEIEFIFENATEIIPVEVKSKNGQTISLNEFIKKYNPQIAYKIIDGNIGVVESKLTIPYYMLMFLNNNENI